VEFNLRIVTEFSFGDVEISCLSLHFLGAQMHGEHLVPAILASVVNDSRRGF
jgi:hypothetical protein